jgi:hypothetical protein
MVPVLLGIDRLVKVFRESPHSPKAFFQFETQLFRLLMEMGRIILQWMINALEPLAIDEMPRELFWDGDAYRCKKRSPMRNLNCLFGKIRVFRWLYEPSEGLKRSSLFPCELQLGIVAGVATPALADRVAALSTYLTQRQLLDVLASQHQVCWGAETLRKVIAGMAAGMAPFRHPAQVAMLLGWLKQAAETAGPRRILLAVGRDGLMLPIRGFEKYKEAAAATISVYNRCGKRLGTIYLGQMPEPGQGTLTDELTRILEAVLSQWTTTTLRLVYITDAGFHPTDYFHQVLSRMVDPRNPRRYLEWEWIVDYYHACQYITQLAEAIFGPGRAAHAWAAKMRRWLKEKPKGVMRVLRSAASLRSIRGLVGEDSDYQTAYDYLRRHASWMDYSTYGRLHVPIGSGVTEAACKMVFTQRFKCAGMKWDLAGGASILTLRVTALSRIWNTVRDAMLDSYMSALPRTPRNYYQKTNENHLQIAG